MRKSNCLLLNVPFFVVLALALLVGLIRSVTAQESGGVVPASYQSGSFFNQNLGTALRFNYHTRGYGTQDDVFSLGGMKVFNMDDSTVFVDGQGTLSDDFGGGFNLGVGYRQLTNSTSPVMSIDPERILGVGFWTDGQSTAADNFFTQLGFNLESLGESFDMRVFGSFPLERTKAGDAVLTGSGTPFYVGNNLFGATKEFTIDTAHSVIDGEFAKRIIDLEAWAFVGGYQIDGGGVDATGYRIGVRGYAVPDVALSLQVTDDNVYSTNVLFGATWFIGRSHKGSSPCGTILDRFREPVLRNDFIATTSRRGILASGNALTEQGSTDAIRIVHVDDGAGGGGDGTFENPFDQVSDIDAANLANSQAGDILLVHSNSNFVGADGVATLQANQQLLGEGVDSGGNQIPHVVATNELGNINLPETAVGAQALGRPTIDAAGLDVFTLADGSLVNNFTINGAGTAVTADGVAAPSSSMLANLQIEGALNGVLLRNTTGAAVIENTVVVNRATGIGLEVDGGAEALAIAATINDSVGRSLSIHDRTGGTVDYTGIIDDAATVAGNFSDGVLIDGNADSTINLTNALNIRVDDGETGIQVTGNTSTAAATPAIVDASGAVDITAAGTGIGLATSGNDDTSAITFADLDATALNGNTVAVAGAGTVTLSSADDTRTIANTGTGNAFFNDGAVASATVTVNSNVENSSGGSGVRIINRAENNVVLFDGTVATTSGGGVFAQNNTDGTILFTQALTLNTADNNAVELVGNTGATFTFADLDIDTTNGDGFVATGGGTLIAASLNGTNAIDVTGTGVGVDLTGMTVDGVGVAFDTVNVGSGNTVGINLENLDGAGQVAIGGGTNTGDGGTLTTNGTAINVSNADNVAITNLTVSNAGAAHGVNVTGQQTGSTATFDGLDVNTADGDAVNLNNNDNGTITFNTLAATTVAGGAGNGIDINNSNASTVAISIDSATVNANGTGRGLTATGGGTISMAGTGEINSTVGTAFHVDNVENLSASDVTIANTGAAGVLITNQDTATDSVVLTNFDVTTTTADAVTASGNTNGTVFLSGLTAESTSGDTVVALNNTGATVGITDMTATATTSGDAFSATGGGTLIATGTNNLTAATGRGVRIEGMTIDAAGATFANVDVTAGASTGVNLNNLTGGAVTVNGGTMTTNGTAVNVANVDDAALNGVTINNGTSNGAGIVVSNAAGDAFSLSNVAIESGTGNGVDITGGTFTATGTNTIETTTGTGLDIDGTTIGGAGASFNTVDVTGAVNGIVLNDLNGGQVRVGSPVATGTNGAGGSLSTTGAAVSVTGVTDAVFNDLAVESSGGEGVLVNHNLATASRVTFSNLGLTTVAGSGNGVVVNDNGTGELDFTLQNSTVDVVLADTLGFTLITAANTGEIDVRLNGNTITADNSSAVLADLNAGTGDVQFLVSGGNDWTNSSAANATASFLVNTNRTLNATIGDQDGTAPFDENRFNNSNGGGTGFNLESNSGAAIVSLDLRGNTASGGGSDFLLTETLGAFGIVDLTNTVTNETNNSGVVDLGGGGVEADFTDLVPPIKQVD